MKFWKVATILAIIMHEKNGLELSGLVRASEQQELNDRDDALNQFVMYDLNQDGYIDAGEIRELNKDINHEDLSYYYRRVDKD